MLIGLIHACGWRTVAFAALLVAAPAPGATAQSPDWSVNPADFESNMSVVVALRLDGVDSTDPNDLVAAFHGDMVRGVAGPVAGGGGLRFFLTIYSDTAGEELSFKVYVAAQDRVLDLSQSVTFAANGIVGSVSDPFVLAAATLGSCSRGRPEWSVNPPDFESNMSVTAGVAFEGTPSTDADDLLAAFVGSEIRGVASPTSTQSGQAFFLTVYSNGSGEEVSFVAYDAVNDLVTPVTEKLTFVPNAVHGAPAEPFAMMASCESTSTGVESPTRFLLGEVSVFPNPFLVSTTLAFELSRPGPVVAEVVDLLGRTVWRRENDILPAGKHLLSIDRGRLASGVYLYRLTNGTLAHNGTLVIL